MRAIMTMAAVGLGLTLSATAGWSDSLSLQKDSKSQAAFKAGTVSSLSSSLDRGLQINGADIKAFAEQGNDQSFKSLAKDASASNEAALDAKRAGLANHKASPDQFAGAGEKHTESQSLAAARLGVGSLSPALKADELKEMGTTNTIRTRR